MCFSEDQNSKPFWRDGTKVRLAANRFVCSKVLVCSNVIHNRNSNVNDDQQINDIWKQENDYVYNFL